MAYSYNATLTENKDQVRFYIGDTDQHSPLLDDEEIESCLTKSNNAIWRACYYSCLAISAKYARRSQVSVQGQQVTQSTVWKAYRQLSLEFLSKARSSNSLFSIVTKDQKDTYEDDSSLIKPGIRVGMTDAVDDAVHQTDNTVDRDDFL